MVQIFSTSNNINEVQQVGNNCLISLASKSYPQHDKALDTEVGDESAINENDDDTICGLTALMEKNK